MWIPQSGLWFFYIKSVKSIQRYLSNKKQRITVGKDSLEFIEISFARYSAGLILGPLIFNNYFVFYFMDGITANMIQPTLTFGKSN